MTEGREKKTTGVSTVNSCRKSGLQEERNRRGSSANSGSQKRPKRKADVVRRAARREKVKAAKKKKKIDVALIDPNGRGRKKRGRKPFKFPRSVLPVAAKGKRKFSAEKEGVRVIVASTHRFQSALGGSVPPTARCCGGRERNQICGKGGGGCRVPV